MKHTVTLLAALVFSSAFAAGSGGGSSRGEAIASLRAIQSALDAGADIGDFKRFVIDAAVKVDRLPDTAKNRPVKDILDLYKQAVRFNAIALSGMISDGALAAAKEMYARANKGSSAVAEELDRMTADIPISSPDRIIQLDYDHEREINRIEARTIASLLILRADDKLKKLK